MLLELGVLADLSTADALSFFVGFAASLLTGLFCLAILVRMTRKVKLYYFALYTALMSFFLHVASY